MCILSPHCCHPSNGAVCLTDVRQWSHLEDMSYPFWRNGDQKPPSWSVTKGQQIIFIWHTRRGTGVPDNTMSPPLPHESWQWDCFTADTAVCRNNKNTSSINNNYEHVPFKWAGSSFLVLSTQAYCRAATLTWRGANVLGNWFRLYLHPVWQHEKSFKQDTFIGESK